jgi:hypothetical protein
VVHVPVAGLYTSPPLEGAPMSWNPAGTSTRPSPKTTDPVVWRGALRLPVSVHWPVAGS